MGTSRLTLVVCFFMCFTFSLLAQKRNNKDNSNNNGQSVTLVVYGTADNEDEAIKTALRSAIEQTFGTFVSANTQIVNDDLVKDEIVSVASGNIEKYSLISSVKDSDGKTSVSVKATVSIGKLLQFAQSKGATTELAGAAFAMNMKMRKLNKENEYQSLCHTLDVLLKISELNLFNFELKTEKPKVLDDYNHYMVSTTIFITPNENYNNLVRILKSTISSLSLTTKEQEEYRQTNDQFYNFPPQGWLESLFDFKKFSFVIRNDPDIEINNKFVKLRNNIWRSAISFEIRDNLKNVAKAICVNTRDCKNKEILSCYLPCIPVFAVSDKNDRDNDCDIYGFTTTPDSKHYFLGDFLGEKLTVVSSTGSVGVGRNECYRDKCDLFQRKPALELSGYSFGLVLHLYYDEKDLSNLSSITVSPISISPSESVLKTIDNSYEKGVTLYKQKNYLDAMKLFKIAAENGNTDAQNNIGYMYENGLGVNKDYSEAFKWYREAAENGNVMAQANTGYMYKNGRGVNKDYSEAFKWYKEAAENGNARAQYNLGNMYYNGQGVSKNSTEALIWLRKAAAQGDENAKKLIENIENDNNKL